MNEILEKAFDNVIDLQRRMEQKTFFYLGGIGVYLGLVESNFESIIDKLLVVLIIIYMLSIIPITTQLSLKLLWYKKETSEINMFYYRDISYIKDTIEIKKTIERKYEIGLNTGDYDLLEQIHINAKIMRIKMYIHFVGNFFLFCIIFNVVLIHINN